MNIEQEYIDANALLDGHFLLASGNHSKSAFASIYSCSIFIFILLKYQLL